MTELDAGLRSKPAPIHIMPVPGSGEAQHIPDDTCWCTPTVAYISGAPQQVFHHQRTAAGQR